jgi:hypothetical protein
MDAIVYSKKVTGPATHAIVIGVGKYPHLIGGGKKQFAGAAGMGQLKSPPQSARAVARWLIEGYSHPEKPLASVSLLLSEPAESKFTFTANGKEKTVKVASATITEVQPAIRAWRELGHENPDHLLLFFFCGHGIARAPYLSLLLADFGEAPVAPLDGALDFRRFWLGMAECEAREQCYFVDACRVGSETLIKNEGFAGRPIIESTGAPNTSDRVRQGPIFFSTLSDAPAYGKPGKPSLYTEALLEALSGAGSGDEAGPWRVRTTLLHDALGFLIKDASQRLEAKITQIAPADELTPIELNVIDAPQIPVVISCKPAEKNSEATLICQKGAFKKERKPGKDSWILRLPVDTYDFIAKTGTNETKKVIPIRPTYRRVDLDV